MRGGFGDNMAGSTMPFPRRHRLLQIVFVAPLLLGAAAPVCSAQQAVTGQSGPVTQLPVFEMHSGFWVNLHHFLYLQARLQKNNPSSSYPLRGAAQPDEVPVSLMDFPEAEIHAWQDAVAFYAKDLANRDLLLNGDMEIINNQLSAMESCPDLEGKTTPLCKSGLRQDLVEALERAAPVYRAHWWAQQDGANREWVAQVAPMIQKMGVELSNQLADVYERPWPAQRLVRRLHFARSHSRDDFEPRSAQPRRVRIRSFISRILPRAGRRRDRSDRPRFPRSR
jgi:hypothetical protein